MMLQRGLLAGYFAPPTTEPLFALRRLPTSLHHRRRLRRDTQSTVRAGSTVLLGGVGGDDAVADEVECLASMLVLKR